MPLFAHEPKSLCFLRLSAIGDVCHAVAAIQNVQKHWPNTKITWVIGKVEAQLLEGLNGVELVVFDKKQGIKGMQSVWQALKGRKFDALIHMQLALRASILTTGIRARYKVGFNFKRAKEGQWLFTNKKIPDTQTQHVLDSFYAFTEYLGVPSQKPTWQLPLSKEDHAFATEQLTHKATVAICPAASKDERNWLPERYAQFADFVYSQGYQVVLCGSPAQREVDLSNSIIQQTKSPIISLVGKTSLKQLTAVLCACELVLAPDSGPAHIATTQGTKVLGLYGHSNPKRTGPYNNIDNVVSVYEKFAEEQNKQPVESLPWSTRVKGANVMQAISLNDVIEAFNKLIKGDIDVRN
ncbi:glycosyltransferase family 9 protein [Vibrio rotiferianus]|uniref:glycosyltransferase family 9 protein n=1 Tax=Vibrio rotiferianus TaxID=190895 RepID=UPI00406A95E8